MPPSEHSEYSPSGMADNMLCLGRFNATKGMDSGSSPAADRGTECHDWAEVLFKAVLDGKEEITKPDFVETWQNDCTKDMVQHALDIHNRLQVHGDVKILLEEKVDLGWMSAQDFEPSKIYGTCDVLMYCEAIRTLVVLDYKTGIGIAVDPKWNVQLMIYALGAMGEFVGKVDKVLVVVSQPRLDPLPKEWEVTPEALQTWARRELLPKCAAMTEPGAPFTPGKKQCQWCAIKGTCRAQRDEMLSLFDSTLKDDGSVMDGNRLSPKDLNFLLHRTKEFTQWVNHIMGAAQEFMENGGSLPDFKLVKGRGSRGWTDIEAAEKFLIGQKLKEKERHTYKLLTPPQAEKVLKENLKRTITKNNFDKLVVKSEGKTTWALRTDKRDEVVINKTAALIDLNDLL